MLVAVDFTWVSVSLGATADHRLGSEREQLLGHRAGQEMMVAVQRRDNDP
jgi:hypothetical protein